MPRRFNYRKVASSEDEGQASQSVDKYSPNELVKSKKSICDECKKKLLKRAPLSSVNQSGSAPRKRSYSSHSLTRRGSKKRRLEAPILQRRTGRIRRNRQYIRHTMNSRRRQLTNRGKPRKSVGITVAKSDSVIAESISDVVISVKSDNKTGDGESNVVSEHLLQKEREISENSKRAENSKIPEATGSRFPLPPIKEPTPEPPILEPEPQQQQPNIDPTNPVT